MAAIAKSPELLQDLGQYSPLVAGVVAMSSGTATVQLGSKLKVVHGAVGNVVDAATGVGEMVTFSVSGTALTIETVGEGGTTTGSSLVMYLAWGIPKA